MARSIYNLIYLTATLLILILFNGCNKQRQAEDPFIRKAYSILDDKIAKELENYVLENDTALLKLNATRCYMLEFSKTEKDSLVAISASILRTLFYDERIKFLGLFSVGQRFVLIYSFDSSYSRIFYESDSLNLDINAYDDSYYFDKMREMDIFPEWKYKIVNGDLRLVEKTERVKFNDLQKKRE